MPRGSGGGRISGVRVRDCQRMSKRKIGRLTCFEPPPTGSLPIGRREFAQEICFSAAQDSKPPGSQSERLADASAVFGADIPEQRTFPNKGWRIGESLENVNTADTIRSAEWLLFECLRRFRAVGPWVGPPRSWVTSKCGVRSLLRRGSAAKRLRIELCGSHRLQNRPQDCSRKARNAL
jgi:hypothetical protein